MYFVCVAIFGVSFVVSVSTAANSCSCKRGLASSTLICSLDGTNDVINATETFCNNCIRAAELQLRRHAYLSSSIVPAFRLFRLKITGEYLNYVLADAFVGHENGLKFVEIKEGALDEIPTAALQRLRYLESLNLAVNSIRYINCSLEGMNLRNLILFDNQISTVYKCAFPPNLLSLSLRNNLIETLNGSLKNHGSLQWLFIGRNKISSLDGELEGLNSVALFDASWNKIVSIGRTPVRLLGLKSLNVSHNHISELGVSLDGFLNLQSLDLSYNDLERLDIQSFANLEQLTYLSVSANRIYYLEDNVFGSLAMLGHLIISQNVITSLDGKLNGLRSLKKLDARWNNIKSITDAFTDLTSLQELDLSHNSIKDLLRTFKGLSKLQRLYLSDNTIKTIQEGLFDQLSNLQVLSLSNNRITDLSGQLFVALTKLTTLDISSNILQRSVGLLVPGFMGIDTESISSPTEDAPEASTEEKCDCRLRKTLRIGGNILLCSSDLTEMAARLKEVSVELTGC